MPRTRKVHTKTDLTVPTIQHHRDAYGKVVVVPDAMPPGITAVAFPYHPGTVRTFDFARFYGAGIDEITYACQRQIERFLARQDTEVEVTTAVSYATAGLSTFLPYLILRAEALRQPLTLASIDRSLIDDFLRHLADSSLARTSQKTSYAFTKAVLQALGRRGLISVISQGDERTFPKNPFPNINRHHNGEMPLTRNERQAFTAAVKTAAMPIFQDDVKVTSELLTYALLIVALHTGRNTTPLLEMVPDCLRSHPKENVQFLVLWKRRGHNTSKVALRADTSSDRAIESMPGVKLPVVRLIRRVVELAEPLRSEAPEHLTNRVWLFRSCNKRNYGAVTALTETSIIKNVRKLVDNAGLVDAKGKPLRINISRLRKTFANRIFELLDGDLSTTAIALGNTPQVAGRNYMAPGEDSQRNWKFLGEVLTEELLNRTLGASERTPAGRCTDTKTGQYAPKKQSGATCFSFLDCLRCRNYVVTGDDLYRLFSFYWRVLREREQMCAQSWDKHYAHIPRLIERDVIGVGLQKKAFKLADVEATRARARIDPHPFWGYDSLASLDIFRQAPEKTA